MECAWTPWRLVDSLNVDQRDTKAVRPRASRRIMDEYLRYHLSRTRHVQGWYRPRKMLAHILWEPKVSQRQGVTCYRLVSSWILRLQLYVEGFSSKCTSQPGPSFRLPLSRFHDLWLVVKHVVSCSRPLHPAQQSAHSSQSVLVRRFRLRSLHPLLFGQQRRVCKSYPRNVNVSTHATRAQA